MRITKTLLVPLMGLGLLLTNCKKDPEISSCFPPELQNSIIAYYPFTNSSLLDATGDQNDLENFNGVRFTEDRAGNKNCAIQLSNVDSNQYLTNTRTGFLKDLNHFSISLWYKSDVMNTKTGYQSIISRGDSLRCDDIFGQWSIGLFECGVPLFALHNSVWANKIDSLDCTGEREFWSDKWHHIVAIKSGKSIKIYVDGKFENEEENLTECKGIEILAREVGDLFIGKNYTGMIDDILLYRRSITETEIEKLFNLPGCAN